MGPLLSHLRGPMQRGVGGPHPSQSSHQEETEGRQSKYIVTVLRLGSLDSGLQGFQAPL